MKEGNENLEKSRERIIYESEKEFKHRFQAASMEEQAKMGYDLLRDADEWDIEVTQQANEWLRGGQPVG